MDRDDPKLKAPISFPTPNNIERPSLADLKRDLESVAQMQHDGISAPKPAKQLTLFPTLSNIQGPVSRAELQSAAEGVAMMQRLLPSPIRPEKPRTPDEE